MTNIPIGKIYKGIDYVMEAEQIPSGDWKLYVADTVGATAYVFTGVKIGVKPRLSTLAKL